MQPLLDGILHSPQSASLLKQEAEARLWLGTALRRDGKSGQALSHLQRAATLHEQMDDPSSPWLARARIELAQCLLDRGDPREAARLLALAGAAQAQQAQLGPQLRRPLQQARARLLQVRAGSAI